MLNRDNQIEVDPFSDIVQNSDPDAWNNFTSNFISDFNDGRCRYGIYNVNMTLDMGEGVSEGVISKLVFLLWTPDEAQSKDKIRTTRATQSFMKQLDGDLVEWHFCDRDEFEIRDLIGRMSIQEDIRTSGGRILTFENMKA